MDLIRFFVIRWMLRKVAASEQCALQEKLRLQRSDGTSSFTTAALHHEKTQPLSIIRRKKSMSSPAVLIRSGMVHRRRPGFFFE